MSIYRLKSVDGYVRDLASDLPAPGGGSAAALAGALGTALAAMVANFTKGKAQFAAVQREIRDVLKDLDDLREQLLELVDEDVEVYQRLSAAYRMPRETEGQQQRRKEAVEYACKRAAGVPKAIAEACDRVIELAAQLCEIGNPNLISDVGCAVRLAAAARHCAWLNVAINLSVIEDEQFHAKMHEALDEAGRKSSEVAEETWRKVVQQIVK
jgi:formiminotetrahydrofolate cyclodeaminase